MLQKVKRGTDRAKLEKDQRQYLSREAKRKSYWLYQLKSGKALNRPSKAVEKDSKDEIEKQQDTNSKRRYILFVGNLPFTASREDILNHFSKKGVHVLEVRMLTKKGSEESKGCCFMELENAKHQQIALKFHQTKFDGRRMNIEITCGGGGHGERRRQKIQERNQKFKDKLKPKNKKS